MRPPVLESLAGAYARLRSVAECDSSVAEYAGLCEECIRDEVRGDYHGADNGIRALRGRLMDVDRATIRTDPYNPRAMEEAVIHVGNAVLRAERWQRFAK